MNKKLHALTSTSIAISLALWCTRISALWGKTELDLNGIDVIKESAEILARTAKMFPTHKMVVGIIGLIMFAQGLRFCCSGLITLISGSTSGSNRITGLITCLVGLNIALSGAFCSLFCYKIAYFIFSK